jgi:hypothetical protein
MVTLALTGIVPPTVDPERGDVMVTIRLPTSWAEAGGADSHDKPRIANRAAASAAFTLSDRVSLIAVSLFSRRVDPFMNEMNE